MIPPRGFKSELYPLNHRLLYSFGLSMTTASMNTFTAILVRYTSDVIAGTPGSIVVNPHHTGYVKDAGPTCCKMSIIDKLSMSLKFNITENFDVDSLQSLKFLWRPIFFSFNEKLGATDDDTGTDVETLLNLFSDTTFEDVVPLLNNTDLPATGSSDKTHPMSTVNIAEVFGDYNLTTNTVVEGNNWNEDLFQEALMRYTNKGALRSMVGRTRHVTLTKQNPYKNFYIDKFVPRAIRRIMPYSFFAIQVHVPLDSDIEQAFSATANTGSLAHLGCKLICNFHEWNADHYQEMSGTPP